MEDRQKLREMTKIVIKIGTSSLTKENGNIDTLKIDKVTEVLSAMRLRGRKVILVTSGAIAVGASKMGYTQRPSTLPEKQALAAIGQAELMNMYARAFDRFNQKVAQVLLTKDGITNPMRRDNTKNTLNTLLDMNIIPIINENDSVATDEIEIGDNDTLSAYTAVIVDAELLIILSDIDGLYTDDPRVNPEAKIIYKVPELTPEIEKMARGAGSAFSTGGMVTKITAARLCVNNGVDMVIAKGDDTSIVNEIIAGEQIGTLFLSKNMTDPSGKKRYFFLGY